MKAEAFTSAAGAHNYKYDDPLKSSIDAAKPDKLKSES